MTNIVVVADGLVSLSRLNSLFYGRGLANSLKLWTEITDPYYEDDRDGIVRPDCSLETKSRTRQSNTRLSCGGTTLSQDYIHIAAHYGV